MTNDTWNPDEYDRFKNERSQPFRDLVALVRAQPGMRVVDLGCGTGELTAYLHRHVAAKTTLGIDSSDAMLAKCAAHAGGGLSFIKGDIGEWRGRGGYDLVLSSAAIQWLPDHAGVFARLKGALAPGGQLAIHMPANDDHPSHTAAAEVAGETPFADALGGYKHRLPLLPIERYAELLDELSFCEQLVRVNVYVHHLDSRDAVVDWVKGTLLTDYERRMPPALFPRFLERYRERLLPRLADRRPYVFTFKRLLIWAAL